MGFMTSSADAKLTLGQQQAHSGEYRAASETFQAVLREEPGNLAARVSLAHVSSYLGRYGEAEKTLIDVIESEPERLEFRIALAQLYTHIGRRGDAIARFREVIEIDPAYGDAWAGIINLASNPGPASADGGAAEAKPSDLTAPAEKILIDAIESKPERLETRVALGQLYAHLGRRADAIARFREVIEIDPVDGDAWAGINNLASNSGPASADGGAARVAEASDITGPADERTKAYRERRRLVLVDRLHPLLEDAEKFFILDGGARDAWADSRWQVLPPDKIKVYAFEPDEAECERLTDEARKSGRDTQFFPIGLWSHEGILDFECNKTGGGSSFLHQNRRITDRWKFENPHQAVAAPDIFFPTEEISTAVTSLESWARENSIENIDFAKLNVQGGELEILRGAGALLDRSLGLLVEVAFVESYEKRPFFSDIDPFLRDRGFTFFDLLAHHYVGRADAPIVAQHLRSAKPALGQLISSWGQLIEGHALYLRDPIAGPGQDPPGRIIKLICIAEIFGQVEYAFELLGWLKARCRDRSQNVLAERLDAIMADAEADYREIM